MKFEMTIPPQNIIDTIMSGLDGGIQYWARAASWGKPAHTVERAERDGVLRFACDLVVHDTGERLVLRDQWVAGLRLMAELYPRRFAEVLDGSAAAQSGDVLIQLSAFGELRYE